MHTVELLEEAMALATRSGFRVRQGWFGGAETGACLLKGEPWIFVDLTLNPREQLEQVLAALREIADPPHSTASPQLHALLRLRKAA